MSDDVKFFLYYTGVVDMVKRMFPPFPIPGFAPNFTGYDFGHLNWNDIYKVMAQAPSTTVVWVRISCQSP